MKFSPEFPGSQGKMINNKLRTSHHQEKETSVPQKSVDLCMPGLKQELEEDKIWNKRERTRGKWNKQMLGSRQPCKPSREFSFTLKYNRSS